MNIRRHRRLAALAVSVLVLGIAVIAFGLLVRARLTAARVATLRLQQIVQTGDRSSLCAVLEPAAVAWHRTATLTRPFNPIIVHLGFLPRIGGDVVALPHVVELAEQGTAAGQALCRLLQPAVSQTALTNRLGAAARALAAHPQDLAAISVRLERADTALRQLLPLLNRSATLTPYRTQLEDLDRVMPEVIALARSAQRVAPELPWLLGLDAPRSYLLALQNPFEIRPTGGFIGLICVIHVNQARPTLTNCQPSEAYDQPAPPDRTMPAPYERYLRLGGWYLRDANWSPDFPTTAQTLEWFWELNRQPAADGVVAVDLYALPILVDTLGLSLSADGQAGRGAQAVNDFLENYYSGTQYRDKAGVGRLLPALVDNTTMDSATLPRFVEAWRTLMTEHHLMLSVTNPAVATWLSDVGWDGGFQTTYKHALRVVEADVGYGGVNAFIERLTHYDIALDAAGSPLTATVTLTFTNRYSPWAEFPTAQAVYGNCTDPATLQLERSTGCYAPYIRVYAPAKSQLLAQEGLEEAYTPDERYGRTVFGGYVRIYPGEQRTLTFRYRLPPMKTNHIIFEKQPGTTDPPFLLTVHGPTQHAARWVGARTDLVFTISSTATEVTLSAIDQATARAQFDASHAFAQGLHAWEAGDRDTALISWQNAAALDRAIDYARLMATRDQSAAAQELLAALGPIDQNGRVAFEQALLLEAEGNNAAADRLYREAALRNPSHPLPVFEWQRRLFASGQIPDPLVPAAWSASAIRHWRERMYAVQGSGTPRATLAYMQVLRELTPDDRELALNMVAYLLSTDQPDVARAQLDALSTRDDLWGRLATAQRARMLNDPAGATASYQLALELADTYHVAYDIADWLREVGSDDAATAAERRAAAMVPNGITTLLREGDEVRSRDIKSARRWYQRAQRFEPTAAAPDFELGLLLFEEGALVEAQQAVEQAVAKAPESTEYRATLDRINTAMSRNGRTPAP